MISLLCSVVIAAPAIALEPECLSARVLVERLAQRSGRALRAAREVENEVLFLSVKPRPIDQWLPLVAAALEAKWEPRGSDMVLTRPVEDLRRLERVTREVVADEIRKRVVELQDVQTIDLHAPDSVQQLERLEKTIRLSSGRNAAAFETFRAQSLMARLLRFLAPAIPADAIARVPIGQKAEYSTRPTPYQLAFPSAADAAFRRFREDHRLAAELLAKASAREEPLLQNALGLGGSLRELGSQTPITFSVCRTSALDLYFVLHVHQGDYNGGDHSRHLSLFADAPPPSLPALDRWKDKPLAPTPLQRYYEQRRPDPELVRSLVQPGGPDFLDQIAGEALRAVAAETRAEVVAWVPDDLSNRMAGPTSEPRTIGGALHAMNPVMSWRNENGMLLARPRLLSDTIATRANREVLRSFLLHWVKGGTADLSVLGRYVTEAGDGPSVTGIELVAVHPCSPTAAAILGPLNLVYGPRDLLVLYHSLSDTAKAALWRGDSVPAIAVPPAGRDALARFVGKRLSLVTSFGSPRQLLVSSQALRPGLAFELRGRPVQSLRASPVMTTGALGESFDPAHAASIVLSLKQGKVVPGFEPENRFQLQLSQQLQMTLSFPGIGSVVADFPHRTPYLGTKPVPFKNLHRDYMDLVNKSLAEREATLNRQGGGRGG